LEGVDERPVPAIEQFDRVVIAACDQEVVFAAETANSVLMDLCTLVEYGFMVNVEDAETA
jgi:hypothetical protein